MSDLRSFNNTDGRLPTQLQGSIGTNGGAMQNKRGSLGNQAGKAPQPYHENAYNAGAPTYSRPDDDRVLAKKAAAAQAPGSVKSQTPKSGGGFLDFMGL